MVIERQCLMYSESEHREVETYEVSTSAGCRCIRRDCTRLRSTSGE